MLATSTLVKMSQGKYVNTSAAGRAGDKIAARAHLVGVQHKRRRVRIAQFPAKFLRVERASSIIVENGNPSQVPSFGRFSQSREQPLRPPAKGFLPDRRRKSLPEFPGEKLPHRCGQADRTDPPRRPPDSGRSPRTAHRRRRRRDATVTCRRVISERYIVGIAELSAKGSS